jgi:hypothetical protein
MDNLAMWYYNYSPVMVKTIRTIQLIILIAALIYEPVVTLLTIGIVGGIYLYHRATTR